MKLKANGIKRDAVDSDWSSEKKTGHAYFLANNTYRLVKNGFKALSETIAHIINAFLLPKLPRTFVC